MYGFIGEQQEDHRVWRANLEPLGKGEATRVGAPSASQEQYYVLTKIIARPSGLTNEALSI